MMKGWFGKTATAVGALVFGSLATPVYAEGLDLDDGRLFVFGDSLSDTGNIEFATGGAIPGPFYFPGRFSNGPIWHDLLKGNLGLNPLLFGPVGDVSNGINFAHGGAQTRSFLANFGGIPAELPGALEQAQSLASLVNSGTIAAPTENDLFAVWIGGNNFLSAISAGQFVPDISQGVSDISQTLETLADVGAQRFLLFSLPLIAGATADDAISVLINDASSAFNDGLRDVDRQLTAQRGLDILYINVEALFTDAELNPSVYGFTEVESNCLSDGLILDACPDTYSLYDSVHPTRATHAFLAEYILATAANVDYGASTIAAQTDLVSELTSQIQDLAMDGASLANDQARGFYVTARFFDGEIDGSFERAASDYDGTLIAGGFQTSAYDDILLFGVQAGYADATSDVSGILSGTADYEGWFLSAYGRANHGRLYASAAAGFALYDIETLRATGFSARPDVVGETDADNVYVSGEVGMQFSVASFGLEPFIRATLSEFSIGGFVEEGVLLNAEVAGQDYTSVVGRAGARLTWSSPGERVHAHVSGAVDHEFDGDRTVYALLNDVDPSIRDLSVPDDTVGRIGAGLSVAVTPLVGVSVGYDGRLSDAISDHAVTGRVTLHLR